MICDVVIAGGGITGLYAALKCIENGYRVILVEKSDRFGGRIKTIYHTPFQYEAGAGRFSQNHKKLRKLLKDNDLHEYPISKKHNFESNASNDHLYVEEVLSKSSEYSDEDLRNITFKHFCENVLGKEKTSLLIASFGYNAEFQMSNAYNALSMFKRDFVAATQYYGCLEGLSELVVRMLRKIQQLGGKCYKETRVVDIQSSSNLQHVICMDGNGKQRTYKCGLVICALPQAGLKELPCFGKQKRRLLNSVVPVSLHRIYGQFPLYNGHTWFQNVPKTTTRNELRQFIPIDPNIGLAMISYSDARYADKWKGYADQGSHTLEQKLLKDLHVVFPNIEDIPKPTWVESHYWPEGVHLWKKGVNSHNVLHSLKTTHDGIFVVGEAYCRNPGWIEGALESVDDVFETIKMYMNNRRMWSAGSINGHMDYIQYIQYIQSKKDALTKKDLAYLKKHFPDFKWVLLQPSLNENVHWLIDVGVWKSMHPGGNVFDERMYKDITKKFFEIPYHHGWDNGLKDNVIEKMKKYKRATVRL